MILILGLGKSGIAAKKLLEDNGKDCIIYDDNNRVEIDYDIVEYAVASPAFKDDHPVIEELKKRNIKIISEIELAYRYSNSNKIIAVTGTNGKTTTTKILGDIIKSPNYKAGNIGIAWSKLCKKYEIAVLEVSSFQLDRIDSFRPNVAIITNIAPDHIDYHGGFEEYKKAKLKIFKNQTKNDFLIVSKSLFDNDLKSIILDIAPQIYVFSVGSPVEKGIYSIDNNIYFKDGKEEKYIGSFDGIKLIGSHNKENVLAAICASLLIGEDIEYAFKKLRQFTPPRHRLEEVLNVNGVIFIDDSKATNVHAVLAALDAIDNNIILLLGGSEKGENFEDLFKSNATIKKYILFGETGIRLKDTADRLNIKNYVLFSNFDGAIVHAVNVAKQGDTILLSPACASFDEFGSYAERGDYFAKKIKEISSFLK